MEALHAQIYCSRRRRRSRGDGNGPLVAVERADDERQVRRRDIAPRDYVQLKEPSRRARRKPDVTGGKGLRSDCVVYRHRQMAGCGR